MAKVLILLGVVVLLWWLLRPRARPQSAARRESRPLGAPQEIIECARCGVHVPRDEALLGPTGALYCCEEHRHAAHPD